MAKTAVLLINLGTPDSPSVADVRSYLRQFLNDPRVMDVPWLARKLLVNLIIVPFRSPKSAKVYRELWTDQGSPISLHGERVRQMLQEKLGTTHSVYLAMRYKNPSIPAVMERIRKSGAEKIIVLPLFPQYASATTGSAHQEVMTCISRWWAMPELSLVSQYWNHPGYIKAFVERGKEYGWQQYDHVLFSYHGLPLSHVDKAHLRGHCEGHTCEHIVNDENALCYKATCYATTRLMADGMGIPKEKYTVCFQSRFDQNWLRPFSDEVIVQKAKEGARKLLVFSPAFVADCLETTIEIGVEYQELFEKHGGQKVQLVASLNDHPIWVDALADMVNSRT